jgi:hypothetical protein
MDETPDQEFYLEAERKDASIAASGLNRLMREADNDEVNEAILSAVEQRGVREQAEFDGDATHALHRDGVPNLLDNGAMLIAMLLEKLGGEVFLSDRETVLFDRSQQITMQREIHGVRLALAPVEPTTDQGTHRG